MIAKSPTGSRIAPGQANRRTEDKLIDDRRPPMPDGINDPEARSHPASATPAQWWDTSERRRQNMSRDVCPLHERLVLAIGGNSRWTGRSGVAENPGGEAGPAGDLIAPPDQMPFLADRLKVWASGFLQSGCLLGQYPSESLPKITGGFHHVLVDELFLSNSMLHHHYSDP